MTLNEIIEHIEGLKFFNRGDRVILALSGGPDSACLFYALNKIKDELDMSIYCVHVNHELRGKSSDADEYFVRDMCKQNNCSLTVISADVAALAKEWKISTEEAGRKVRYQAFYEEAEKVYKDCGVLPKIAIAHNKDDQAETILFRIIRGTGVTGLKAMHEVETTEEGFDILRPLLGISKCDILDALDSQNLTYCNDKTNEQPIYARNKIRLEIIPAMECINPALKDAVVRLGDIAREQEDFLDSMANSCLEKLRDEHKIILSSSMSMIPVDELSVYNVAIQKRVLSLIIRLMGIFENIGYKHMESIVNLLKSDNPSAEINLPRGYTACRIYEEIGFFSDEFLSMEDPFIINISTAREITKKDFPQGACLVKEYHSSVDTNVLQDSQTEQISKESSQDSIRDYACFENENLHFNIFLSKELFEEKFGKSKQPVLRYRQPGDYMSLKGGVKKKIKNIFVDDKIPRILRDQVPLLAVGSEVIWIGDLTGRTNGRLSGDFQIENINTENDGESSNAGWFRIEILRKM